MFLSHAPRERVSWNFLILSIISLMQGHAPRERVSWNFPTSFQKRNKPVTLHVSVWVEILNRERSDHLAWSRSTWACELKSYRYLFLTLTVPKSRSTWACELKFWIYNAASAPAASRSTWACELKLTVPISGNVYGQSHAPRERVSWNPRVWRRYSSGSGHAPRERVSWNNCILGDFCASVVTLHVSVWVEIALYALGAGRLRSRSTWACELKFHASAEFFNVDASRSTWACELKWQTKGGL